MRSTQPLSKRLLHPECDHDDDDEGIIMDHSASTSTRSKKQVPSQIMDYGLQRSNIPSFAHRPRDACIMIRNVLIMAGSGLALFYKEFQNSLDANRSKILCALITTVLEFSKQTTGMAVSFIEFSHLFLTIVTHEPTKISCAVFYDRGDGKLFGRLICGEILNAFVQDYPIEIFQQGPNLKDFKGFYQRMPAVIYYSVKPVLLKLEGTTGINRAILVRDKEVIHTHQYPEVDCFTLLTNLSTFVEMADNMILEGNDFVQNIAVDTDEQQRLIIWKVRQHCLLICLIDATIPSEEYADNVEEALELIEQIGNLHEDLKMIMNREK